MTVPGSQPPNSILAGFLSYLIPGLGQIYQGRIGKGILFMVSLLSMFFLGQAMGNWKNVYLPEKEKEVARGRKLVVSLIDRWHYGGQFWIGIAAWPALWQHFKMPVPAQAANPFWHNFQKEPREEIINNYLRTQDKIPDLAWVYTVIAGILNILVIYDAFAGPAFGSGILGQNKSGPSFQPVQEGGLP